MEMESLEKIETSIQDQSKLDNFLKILKDIKPEGKKLKFDINPFFINFLKAELMNQGIDVKDENLKQQITNYLFSTFQSLCEDDKLTILFSYVVLNYFVENLDNDKKEAILKVSPNSKVAEHKEFKILFDLDIFNLNKSIIVRLFNFDVDKEYERMHMESIKTKRMIIKYVLISILGTLSIFTLLYFIPYTHDYLFENNFSNIFENLFRILKLIFLTK